MSDRIDPKWSYPKAKWLGRVWDQGRVPAQTIEHEAKAIGPGLNWPRHAGTLATHW